jgi:hypothetical protein
MIPGGLGANLARLTLSVFGEIMKSLYLRSSMALACALSLAACGGGGGNLQLGGSVIGLTKGDVVLQNNGGAPMTVSAPARSFVFPELIGTDTGYDVTIKGAPTHAVCTVTNGKGKSGAFSINSVVVSCTTFSYELRGTVVGLRSDGGGLTLANGSEQKEVDAGATTFTMSKFAPDGTYISGKVADGAPFGVTVLRQPGNQTCSVENGVGTMGSAPKTDVKITCV